MNSGRKDLLSGVIKVRDSNVRFLPNTVVFIAHAVIEGQARSGFPVVLGVEIPVGIAETQRRIAKTGVSKRLVVLQIGKRKVGELILLSQFVVDPVASNVRAKLQGVPAGGLGDSFQKLERSFGRDFAEQRGTRLRSDVGEIAEKGKVIATRLGIGELAVDRKTSFIEQRGAKNVGLIHAEILIPRRDAIDLVLVDVKGKGGK